MLKHLAITNYAIIDTLEIDFDARLNIITGETGAGKSIILGALNMILGRRADLTVLRDKAQKAVVEGIFDVASMDLQDLFEQLELEYEDETIIRREIRPNGKSRAFVNDSPVTLDQLRSLAGILVDLHAQQDNASILQSNFYLSVLDRLAGQEKLSGEFGRLYQQYRAKQKKWEESRRRLADQRSDLDYLEFQYGELCALQLKTSDGQALEDELNMLENAGQIAGNLQNVSAILEDGQVNTGMLLAEAQDQLRRIASYGSELRELQHRLDSACLELSDIARTAESLAEDCQLDEARLEELRERHSEINRLLQKHRLEDVEGLIAMRENLGQRLNELRVSDDDLAELEKEVAAMRLNLSNRANFLSENRLKFSSGFEKEVKQLLTEVGMPHARVELQHTSLDGDSMDRTGTDHFELYFSANKGVDVQALRQVASGGERSRLMLAVKSTLARYMKLPTMIFDEIDTGISGEVAGKVGEVFKRMAGGLQVIAITHLPQIAAQADRHLFVSKDDTSDKTAARIKALDEDDKVLEIAKMLSGERPGQAAVMAASELLCVSAN